MAWWRLRAGRTLVERPPGLTPGLRTALALGAGLLTLAAAVGVILAMV